jgi:hypothetical protein
MKTRITDRLFSNVSLARKIAREYKSLNDYSIRPEKAPDVINRINELYAQLFSYDLNECHKKLKNSTGDDVVQLNNLISILNHLMKVQKFDETDLAKLIGCKLDCAAHITDFLKFRLEMNTYVRFLYDYLAALKDEVTWDSRGLTVFIKPNQKRFSSGHSSRIEIPTCGSNIRKILAKLNEHTPIDELFSLLAKVRNEFNNPEITFKDNFLPRPKIIEEYCRDNLQVINAMHFNDVVAGKVYYVSKLSDTPMVTL